MDNAINVGLRQAFDAYTLSHRDDEPRFEFGINDDKAIGLLSEIVEKLKAGTIGVHTAVVSSRAVFDKYTTTKIEMVFIEVPRTLYDERAELAAQNGGS